MKRSIINIMAQGLIVSSIFAFVSSRQKTVFDPIQAFGFSFFVWCLVMALVMLTIRLSTSPILGDGEKILKEEWGIFTSDQAQARGVFYLTNEKLYFKSHPIGESKHQFRVGLGEVNYVSKKEYGLEIKVQNQNPIFISLNDSAGWAAKIHELKSNLTPPESE